MATVALADQERLSKVFLGNTPSTQRHFITGLLARLRARGHKRVYVPCCGQFALVGCALAAGYKAEQVVSSDISLFSSLLGYLYAGRPIAELGIEIPAEHRRACGQLRSDAKRVAYLMWLLKVRQLREDLIYERLVRDDLVARRGAYVNQLAKQLAGYQQRYDGVRYEVKDLREELTDRHPTKSVVLVNPPAYCLARHERILSADLRWVAAGELRVGDEIIAFDEHSDGRPRREPGARRRHWKVATVTRSQPAEARCVRVILANGDAVICTTDHPWLSGRRGAVEWRTANQLHGRHVRKVFDVWPTLDSYDAGWLAGMFDAEGTTHHGKETLTLSMAQREGPLLDRAVTLTREFGFDPGVYGSRADGCRALEVRGGVRNALRFLGTVRPERLLEKAVAGIEARAVQAEQVQVVAVEPVGIRPIQTISTDAHTYVGAGYLMHNSGGYERLFEEFEQEVGWDPQVSAFEWDDEYEALYEESRQKPEPFAWYRYQTSAGFPRDEVVFARRYTPERADYWLFTKPELIGDWDWTGALAQPGADKRRPWKAPILDHDYELTADSKVTWVSVGADAGLYYRDLWCHKLGDTNAERFVLLLVDGYVFGVVGLHTNDLMAMRTEYAYETFGFNAPLAKHPKANRLLMLLITCADFMPAIREGVAGFNRCFNLVGLRTTCLAKYRKVKLNNGILDVIGREKLKNGMYKIKYECRFRDETFADCVKRYLEEEQADAR